MICDFAAIDSKLVSHFWSYDVFQKAFENYDCEGDPSYQKFINENVAWLEDYSLYMAIKDSLNGISWIEWPKELKNREKDALAEAREKLTKEVGFYCFQQYWFFKQWTELKTYANEKGVEIIGDVPIYVAFDSADAWAQPELFQFDENNLPVGVAGCPPDAFSATGQLWGNPLYDYEKMESDGFAWWKRRVSKALELFDGLRIDHFRGFESFFSVPSDAKTAREGKWVKGPGKKLIDAIKSVSGEKLIIAEDLGDITPEVKELVDYSGFPGMRVFQFAFLGGDNPHLPHNFEKNCVAYSGTHDNNTLLGYLWELDGGTRQKMLEYCGFKGDDWGRGCDDIIRTLFASSAGLLMLPIQDVLGFGSDTRLNRPGIASGNWAFRVTAEQLSGVDRSKYYKLNQTYFRGII